MARPSLKTASESYPRSGNRELLLTLDFTNVGTILDDLFPEMSGSQIETIQSVYIDNSQNPSTLTFQFNQGQTLVAQPYTQGIYPVIAAGNLRYTATTTPGLKIPIIFSNVAKPYQVWGPVPGANIIPALTYAPLQFSPLDDAGDNVIVAGVALQTVKVYRLLLSFGAAANIQFFNGPSANADDLTGFQYMFAGGFFNPDPSGIPLFKPTTAGNGLIMTSSAASVCGGMVGYVQS